MSFVLTPNWLSYSDSYTYSPIIPSTVATVFRPNTIAPVYPVTTVGAIGATVIIPGPILPLPANYDLNKDARVHQQVVNYFRYKTLDKWLYDDMREILGYFVVSNGQVSLLKKLNDYREDSAASDSAEDTVKKIKYIENYWLTIDRTYKILLNLVSGANLNWYDLHKNDFFVKDAIRNGLKKKIKETIMNQQ